MQTERNRLNKQKDSTRTGAKFGIVKAGVTINRHNEPGICTMIGGR